MYFKENWQSFTLHTQNTTYQMKADQHSVLVHTYYGPRVAGGDLSYLVRYADRAYPDLGGGVLQEEDQRLRFLLRPPEGGQALQGVLPPAQLAAGVAQVRRAAAAGQLQLDGGQAEIPHVLGLFP